MMKSRSVIQLVQGASRSRAYVLAGPGVTSQYMRGLFSGANPYWVSLF